MRKALVPMLVSLALCAAATTALVISTAHAQPGPHQPMMVAASTTSGLQLAADDAPPPGPPPPRHFGPDRPVPADMANRLKEMCQDGVARQTGRLAYLETRLSLTPAEQPLFQRWKDARLGIARRNAAQCGTRVSDRLAQPQSNQGQNDQTRRGPRGANRPGPADRMAREEDRLKQRLADIQVERPALEALYNALSPEQKTALARAGMRGRGEGGMMRRARFAREMGPRGPMGRPPMGGAGVPPLER